MKPLANITEIKLTLDGRRQVFDCQLMHGAHRHAVVLFVIPADARVADLALAQGTLTLGYFWQDRPYNLYHWLRPNGQTLGWYFNISDSTTISETQVKWRDLEVDLLITPDGRRQVLDEEKLPATLSVALKHSIASAKSTLLKYPVEELERIAFRSRRLLREAGRL